MAQADPWDGRAGIRGFKDNLISRQGDDVYRHLFGHAGGVLAAPVGGAYLSAKHIAIDLVQLLDRKEGAFTELLNDAAGLAIGRTMNQAVLSGDYRSVTKEIKSIICK